MLSKTHPSFKSLRLRYNWFKWYNSNMTWKQVYWPLIQYVWFERWTWYLPINIGEVLLYDPASWALQTHKVIYQEPSQLVDLRMCNCWNFIKLWTLRRWCGRESDTNHLPLQWAAGNSLICESIEHRYADIKSCSITPSCKTTSSQYSFISCNIQRWVVIRGTTRQHIEQ